MRAPFSEILPIRRGVSILTRGAAAIAASRLTAGAAVAGWVIAGALADGVGAAPVCGVAVVVPLPFGVGFTNSLWICSAARRFSICGMLKKTCQPSSTRPDRTTARMVLRLSVIVQVSSFSSVCGQRYGLYLTRFLYENRCPLRSKTL